MGFNLCPDGGPPRLWRFVPPGVLPAGLLCDLDRQQNLLIIDKEKYDSLSWVDQHQTLRTDGSIEYSHRHTVKREAPDLSKVFSTLA